jgi:hypothetical protein
MGLILIPSSNLWRHLPARWFQIPDRAWNHPQVVAYRTSQVRFETVHAGRRSFKTEIGKRRVVGAGLGNPGKRYFFGGPTRDQTKRIAWKDLKDLTPEWAKKRVSESELFIELVNRAELHCIGFDRPERFEGTPWDGGVLTEFPHFSDTAWNENIAPALRDTGGWAIIEGVPEGRNHYWELSQYAKTSGDPEWADYCWTTAEVRDPAEIEKERARLDERTFRQEYEGSFESYEGRAYSYYDPDVHRKPVSFESTRPICVAADFNLDPCIWLIGQARGDIVVVGDEIKQRQTDIWKMCAELKHRLTLLAGDQVAKRAIIFYGDLEHGKSRSVSATTGSWEIIKQEFSGYNVEYRLRSHPRIVDRVNAFNSKLRNARGESRFVVDPRCVELHRDLEMVDMNMLTKETDTGDRTHASDAVGYWISVEWPIKQRSAWTAI